jgi:all-trans-8'-apo-beta-carotenal 15,15'-oxygenase
MATAHAPQPPHAPGLPAANLSLDLWSKDLGREHGFEPLTIEGKLPAGLRGTLYRNGPGQFGQFGKRYTHSFEGDGAVTAVRIGDGRAYGASRLTLTAGLADERAAGKLRYGFAAPWPTRILNGLRGRDKNTANTSVVMWQGRLFALMEGGKPTELDPGDLAMIGETDLGAITSMFSAHPHRVEARKAIYNFGLSYGRVTKLHMYELPDEGAARQLGTIELARPPMLHDFIATQTHLIFFVSPVCIDIPRALLALGGFDKLVRWKPALGTEVICVPIDRPGEPVRFTVDAFYQWHFANAYGLGGELVVDYVRYPTFDTFHDIGAYSRGEARSALGAGRYHRARIDLAARTLVTEQQSERACEFPTLAPGTHGQPHAVTYGVFDDLQAIGAIDRAGKVTAHQLPADQRATEPLYVDGHLLALCHAQDRAFVAVYDAARIPDGPIAKLWIDHHVPITFHGTFHGMSTR